MSTKGNEIPEVQFQNKNQKEIEVMSFTEMYAALNNAQHHDPFAMHRIDFFMILIVLEQSYTHYIDFQEFKISAGSILCIAKNQVHKFTHKLKDTNGISILFNEEFVNKNYILYGNHKLKRLFNYHIDSPLVTSKQLLQEDITDLSKKMHSEYTNENIYLKQDVLSSILYILLLKIERAKKQRQKIVQQNKWLDIFNSFRLLLERKYVQTRNSNDYAAELHISYKHLNDAIKQITGLTAKAFIDRFIVLEMKRYLISTPLSIKEVSFKTGFDEPANMVKFFKKHTKSTPRQYRLDYSK